LLVVKTMEQYVVPILKSCVTITFDLWMSKSFRHDTFTLVINFINL
jgi:hypothetical protein